MPFSQGFHSLTSDRRAPDFELTDVSGKPARLSDIKDYRYVFFGFTRCTTVCPSTWAELRRLQSGFDEASAPKIVFVRIDSHYDSPAELSARFADSVRTLYRSQAAQTGFKALPPTTAS